MFSWARRVSARVRTVIRASARARLVTRVLVYKRRFIVLSRVAGITEAMGTRHNQG
jgi:hypothetical protein